MKKKKHKCLLCILSYLYLFVGFSYIIYYISYNIRITNKLEGWAVMVFVALLYFVVYVAINHILIRKLMSNRLLMIIEAFLFAAMLTLLISDLNYDHYRHLEYLQRTKPAAVIP